MTDIAAIPRAEGGVAALIRQARYVVAENPVTGFAFGLFVLIVILAAFGPDIVPYNPLASSTAEALQPPSAHHWFGTDQLGRDVFSRVIVATRLDFFIAVASVALVFIMGGLAGIAAGFFGGWEVVLIIAAFLILFGAKKVPELMHGLGKGLKEFKKATRDVTDELNSAMDDSPPPPKKLPPDTVHHEETPASTQSSSGPKTS